MQETAFLAQSVILLGAALLVAWLFRVLRAPSVIGFLFAGIAIGPSGLQLIEPHGVEQFAELGLVMLLFTIGLELSPEPLLRGGLRLFGAAAIQAGVTALAAFIILRSASNTSWAAGVITAAAIALSSTAIVLKQLAERRETESPGGVLVIGILLLQDVFVILLMLFLPLFAPVQGADWKASVREALLAFGGLALVTIAARRVLPFVLQQVIRWGGRELTTLFAVVMAVAGAWLAGLAGWSLGFGACIAGLLLSQTDMRHQLIAEIIPFRDVFNALFFISMGMLVDLTVVAPALPILGLAVVATLAVKALLTAGAVVASGWPLRLGAYAGIGLCTVSEFGYVLAREADRLSILPPDLLQFLTAYIVGTMMIGAMFFPIATRASIAIARLLRPGSAEPSEIPAEHALKDHVVIVGFGLNGHNLAKVLKATNIPFCVVEMNRSLATKAREEGARVLVGDAARWSILSHGGLSGARALVIAINDLEATRRIVAQARASSRDLYILARTRYISELEVLYRLGADQVIPEEFETSIEIFAHVLKHFCIPDNVIEAQITMIRAGGYGMLRGSPAAAAHRSDLLALLESTATQTFLLDPRSPACGRTIRDMDLRAQTGVTIIAIVRRGRPLTNPQPDATLEAGDVLVLVGVHQQLDIAKGLLAPANAPSDE